MVTTILPMGHGKRRIFGAPAPLWCHTVGIMLGSMIVAFIVWALSQLVHAFAGEVPAVLIQVVFCLTCSMYAADGIGLWRAPRPQSKWQVPKRWLNRLPDTVAAGGFGLLLGFGFLTRLQPTLYPAIAWLLMASPSLEACTATFLVLGLVRVTPLWALAVTARSLEHRERATHTLDAWSPAAATINAAALAIAAALHIGAAIY